MVNDREVERKAVDYVLAFETCETVEIIRRRLFEWGALPADGARTAAEYSDWGASPVAYIWARTIRCEVGTELEGRTWDIESDAAAGRRFWSELLRHILKQHPGWNLHTAEEIEARQPFMDALRPVADLARRAVEELGKLSILTVDQLVRPSAIFD